MTRIKFHKKYLPKKPSRDNGNAGNGNFWNGNSGDDGSSGSSDEIGNSSIESNRLDEKPSTVIGVRYFAYLPSLPFLSPFISNLVFREYHI